MNRAAFLLQVLAPATDLSAEASAALRPPRFGFTVTKKIGTAVVRNRIRRRLREAVRIAAPAAAVPGTDYVLVARPEAINRPFDRLVRDIAGAIASARQAPAEPAGAKPASETHR